MNNNFLLEILVQELPYKFIPSAISQLDAAFRKVLAENGLNFGDIKVYATPRRLAVIVEDLADKQTDVLKEFKGPILSIALNEDGSYSNAALGFAKKNGVGESELYQKDGYIWARVELKGKSSKEVISQNAENIVLSLQGAHFMRWGDLDVKFSRPIENVVALFNDEILPLSIVNVQSSNTTKGHRFSKNKEVKITNPLTYEKDLESANVIADPLKRRELIINSASNCAKTIDAVIDFDSNPELLDEVTFITEYPVPVLCEFDKKYLNIPDIVNVTVMSTHQRYFPLYKDGKLLNNFITMANFVGTDELSFDNIRRGNQRVVCARLEDGIFFYQDDTKTPLIEKLPELKGMTFQKGLGTLYDKTQRIVALSDFISDELNVDKKDVLRCATLSKADLSTKLVFEFTELQGFIGEDYARKSGEGEIVAKGISEHYYPLNATSEIASTITGQIVGIADKIDTIVAVFLSTQDNKKRRPTGSNDPLGVRRAVFGVLKTILNAKLNLNLSLLIDKSMELISKEFEIKVESDTKTEIEEFFINRLIGLFDKKYPQDILLAVASSAISPLENVCNFTNKVDEALKIDDKVIENAVRVSRIVQKYLNIKIITPSLFVFDEEKQLFETLSKTDNVKDFSTLALSVDKFFDKVLVMDKDEKIKENRIALLNSVKDKFNSFCDFEKIKLKG